MAARAGHQAFATLLFRNLRRASPISVRCAWLPVAEISALRYSRAYLPNRASPPRNWTIRDGFPADRTERTNLRLYWEKGVPRTPDPPQPCAYTSSSDGDSVTEEEDGLPAQPTTSREPAVSRGDNERTPRP